jgi:hypothetical protein
MAIVHDLRLFALREDYFSPDEKEEPQPISALEAKKQANEQAQQRGNTMRQRKKTNRRTDLT